MLPQGMALEWAGARVCSVYRGERVRPGVCKCVWECWGVPDKQNIISLFFYLFHNVGPALPYNLRFGAMAEFPNGGGVLLFGGQAQVDGNIQDEDKILEFIAGANSWKILNITLQKSRGNHVVIPLL